MRMHEQAHEQVMEWLTTGQTVDAIAAGVATWDNDALEETQFRLVIALQDPAFDAKERADLTAIVRAIGEEDAKRRGR